MLNKSKVITFVSTADPPKAREFYERILGLSFVSDEPYALVFEANGIMLRIAKVQEFIPAKHTVLGWEVDNIRSTIQELTKRHVRFERYSGLQQDDLGICTFPSGGKVAWFRDPDGNVLSLTQFSA